MIRNWKWVNYVITLFYQGRTIPSVVILSIAKESQSKLQGTKNGWFQWLLSDNQLNRIEQIDTIESLLERHQAAQKMGIAHVVVLESGKSDFLQQLIQAGKENIKIIFRNHSPSDVVHLLCQPDTDILAAWQEICQGNQKKRYRKYFKSRTLAKAYGESLNERFKTLHEDDLKDYLPMLDRFFLPSEFTYVGIEERALVFALTAFPSAWLTLKNSALSKTIVANYAGAFIEEPKLKFFLGRKRDWNQLDNPFWMKWLKKCRVPQNDLENAGFRKHPTLLKRPIIWVPALVSISPVAVVAVILLRLVFMYPSLFSEIIPKEFLLHQVFQEQENKVILDSVNIQKDKFKFIDFEFIDNPRGGSHSPRFSSCQAGYDDNIFTDDNKFVLFWQFGKWIRLLDAACAFSQGREYFDFHKQGIIAEEFIQAFEAYELSQTKMIKRLQKIKSALSKKDFKHDDLCGELAQHSQRIFGYLSKDRNSEKEFH